METQTLILSITLAVVFHVFDAYLIWHLAVFANLIQDFSHFISADVRSHFKLLCSWISTGIAIWQKKKNESLSLQSTHSCAESHLKSHDA